MRRLSFILYLLFIISASYAQEQVVTVTTVAGEDTYVTHYLYDAQARPFLLLTDGLSMQYFTYNDAGQYIRQDYTDLTGKSSNVSYVYTYNESGLIATEEEFYGERSNGTTTFTYDEHGNRTSMTNSRTGLPIPIKNAYDAAGHLIRVDVCSPMDYNLFIQTTVYTYEGDRVVKEEEYNYNELTNITTLTYDDAGLLVKEVTTSPVTEENPEEVVLSTTTYAYADIDVSFAPYNVQAVAGDGNTITVTWEGTANTVVVDGKRYAVTGNTFTTPVLVDGTYTVYVANNGNATASEPIDIADNTKVGASNVQLNGDIYVTTEIRKNYYDEDVEVKVYNIPIKWEIASATKPVSYRIYYNSTYYVDVEDGSLTSYDVPAVNFTNYIIGQGVVTLDTVIRVIAIYETGEMEPNNTITLDTEAILALNVQGIQADSGSTEVYTLSGIRLPSRDNLRPGTYVFRHGKVARKVQTR